MEVTISSLDNSNRYNILMGDTLLGIFDILPNNVNGSFNGNNISLVKGIDKDINNDLVKYDKTLKIDNGFIILFDGNEIGYMGNVLRKSGMFSKEKIGLMLKINNNFYNTYSYQNDITVIYLGNNEICEINGINVCSKIDDILVGIVVAIYKLLGNEMILTSDTSKYNSNFRTSIQE